MSEIAPKAWPLTEADVRTLRDNIYGPQHETSWDSVKAYWMKEEEVRWLLAHQPTKK